MEETQIQSQENKEEIKNSIAEYERDRSLRMLEATDMSSVVDKESYKAKVLDFIDWQLETYSQAVKLASLNRRFGTVRRKLDIPVKEIVMELVREGKLLLNDVGPKHIAVLITTKFRNEFVSGLEEAGGTQPIITRALKEIIENPS